MIDSIVQTLDGLGRRLAPFATTVLLVVLNAIPLPLPDYRAIVPLVPLMAVFYWALYRPDLMPAAGVFLIGVLDDVLTGAPLGLNALIFLAVLGFVRRNRRLLAGRTFPFVWGAFAIIVLAVGAANWLIATFLFGANVRSEPAIGQLVLTFALFPIVAWLLIQVLRAFLARA